MKAIVTCGPSFEPIDQVRRITNSSTGELGVQLAEQLASSGVQVTCLKGSGATYPGPSGKARVEFFDTNDDLLQLLQPLSGTREIGAIFHVAALCDYKVSKVENEKGEACASPKIPSRSGALTLTLEPATKVISRLRGLFPEAVIVGWKYELAGTREDALARALRQMDESRSDACVVNGEAYGPGFGFCERVAPVQEFADKPDLIRFLTNWILSRAKQ
jgi:phosphopantothenoylcysteine synthetase/decarboxylase